MTIDNVAMDVSTRLFGIFFTLFSTLWCSIRPDFPSHHDSKLRILSIKLNIIFWALICPEAVLYWALRQWFEAGKIAKEFRHRGWTRRHGLFLLMGGFVLCDEDGQPSKTLAVPHFRWLLRQPVIDFPQLTSSEIQERSNFHPAIGVIAFLQAAWLITKCLSRFINASLTGQGLSVITQLEAMTAAIVFVNWCTFFFAFQKPLGVQSPILIKPIVNPSTRRDRSQRRGLRTSGPFEREQNLPGSQGTEQRFQLEFPQPQTTSIYKITANLRLTPHSFISALLWPIKSVYTDVAELTVGTGGPYEFPDGTLKVPLFYVPNTILPRMVILPITILGMGVSSVSLLFIRSTMHFSSQAAKFAWRICSIASASISAFMLGLTIFINVFYLLTPLPKPGNYGCMACLEGLSDFFLSILIFTLFLVLLPFLLARVVLLVVSVIDLRPALGEVFWGWSWADYIPHFS